MQRWNAYILTQSNRLEVVEFDSPNIVREDAREQCKAMFGAKEVNHCNPIYTPSEHQRVNSYADSYTSNQTSSAWFWFFLIIIGLAMLLQLFQFLVLHWMISLPVGVLAIILWRMSKI